MALCCRCGSRHSISTRLRLPKTNRRKSSLVDHNCDRCFSVASASFTSSQSQRISKNRSNLQRTSSAWFNQLLTSFCLHKSTRLTSPIGTTQTLRLSPTAQTSSTGWVWLAWPIRLSKLWVCKHAAAFSRIQSSTNRCFKASRALHKPSDR